MLLTIVRGWAWLLRLNNSLLLQRVSQRCWAYLVVPSLSLFCHRSYIVRSGELPHRFHHVIMNMTLLDKIEVTSGLRFSRRKSCWKLQLLNLLWNLRIICFIVLLIKSLIIYYVKKNSGTSDHDEASYSIDVARNNQFVWPSHSYQCHTHRSRCVLSPSSSYFQRRNNSYSGQRVRFDR